jgi:hypothetical protein
VPSTATLSIPPESATSPVALSLCQRVRLLGQRSWPGADSLAWENLLQGKGPIKGPSMGELAMFVIRVTYPGGHSVWLTRRFPTVAWGLKKDALPFPTEADAARTIVRLRPPGPVSIEPIP